MGYVKLGNMEMEWDTDKDYQQCLMVLADFKNMASKEWELMKGGYDEEGSDEEEGHSGSEGLPAE